MNFFVFTNYNDVLFSSVIKIWGAPIFDMSKITGITYITMFTGNILLILVYSNIIMINFYVTGFIFCLAKINSTYCIKNRKKIINSDINML